jgi:hypothetical protein
MPTSVPKISLKHPLAALGASACLLLAAGTSAAQAATAGVVPPRNPASDCNAGGGSSAVDAINSCRAAEGIGPLVLPGNWSSLTPVQQGFVLINLERVNRGLPAIVGLNASLNGLASSGASRGTDPSFPSGPVSGGGIWAGAYSVLQADYLWMYVDGPGGDNLDCTSGNSSGCWGHRDIMLSDRSSATLVAGGGFATAGGTDSLAYLVLSGYSTSNLTFTWAGELKYFASKPAVEPLGKVARARHHKKKHRRHHKSQIVTVTASGSSGSSGSSGASGSSASDSGPTISIG